MQNKSTAQIQAELRLMRLAYYERERRHESLNHYLGTISPLAKAMPYILSLGTVIGGIVILIGIFF